MSLILPRPETLSLGCAVHSSLIDSFTELPWLLKATLQKKGNLTNIKQLAGRFKINALIIIFEQF